MIDATERLAVVDQEWQHLRAVDLLVVLRSFAPKSGEVLKVTVYPSDFGLKRMAEEARHGPLAAFGKTAGDAKAAKAKEKKKKKRREETTIPTSETYSETYSDDSDDFDSPSETSESDVSEDEEDANVVRERMRQYERDRMTYYYAVCECDSAETARRCTWRATGWSLSVRRTSSTCGMSRTARASWAEKYETRRFPCRATTSLPSFRSRRCSRRTSSCPGTTTTPRAKRRSRASSPRTSSRTRTSPRTWRAPAKRATTPKRATTSKKRRNRRFPPTLLKRRRRARIGSEIDAAAAKKAYLAKLLGGGDDAEIENDDDAADDDDDDDEDAADSGDEGFKRAAGGVGDGVGSQSRYGDKTKKSRGGGGDMQVTFHAGLEALDEKMRRRKEELSGVKETVWEKRLREKAEKRGRLNAKKKKNDALDDPRERTNRRFAVR